MKANRLFLLNEEQFLLYLKEITSQTGNISDVFQQMVMYSVPLFILKNLWQDKYKQWQIDFKSLSFGVSEKNWKGKIENLSSKIFLENNNSHAKLIFKKNFIINCEKILILCKISQASKERNIEKSNVALVCINKSNQQKWKKKNDELGNFSLSTNYSASYPTLFEKNTNTIYHYTVESFQEKNKEIIISKNDFIMISKKKYLAISIQIFRREITSLAIIALGCLIYYNIKIPQELIDIEQQILQNRSQNKLTKNSIIMSKEIISFYVTQMKIQNKNIHPLWKKIIN